MVLICSQTLQSLMAPVPKCSHVLEGPDKVLVPLPKTLKFLPNHFHECAWLDTRKCNDHRDKLILFFFRRFSKKLVHIIKISCSALQVSCGSLLLFHYCAELEVKYPQYYSMDGHKRQFQISKLISENLFQ